jgi:hypothetical protein
MRALSQLNDWGVGKYAVVVGGENCFLRCAGIRRRPWFYVTRHVEAVDAAVVMASREQVGPESP